MGLVVRMGSVGACGRARARRACDAVRARACGRATRATVRPRDRAPARVSQSCELRAVVSPILYRVDRNLAGDVMEPVLWTLYTYVGGLRFDQDLALLEIKLGFQGNHLVGRWCAGRIFMVSSTNILN